jgi:integrase
VIQKKRNELRVALEESRSARFDGYEFIASTDRWHLSKDVSISLKWARHLLPKAMSNSLRICLAQFAERYAAGTVNRLNETFKSYVKWVIEQRGAIVCVTSGDLLGYREYLAGKNQNSLYSISSLIRGWHRLGLSGVDGDAAHLLREWRLKGDPKGVAVLTRDPYKGPLSDVEFEALHIGLVHAYEKGLIDLEDFTLTMLFVVTGRRPRQLGDLKSKDLLVVPGVGNVKEYAIRIPRIKQGSDVWRSDFRDFALEPNLAWMVTELLKENKEKLFEIVPNAAKELFDELPLFPQWRVLRRESGQSIGGLVATMRTIYFHRTTDKLRGSVRSCTDLLCVSSERVSGHIHIFPTRLRRTLGVRAAKEGYGELVIAELLDHTDTQNVKVYTGNVPENVDAINKAVALQLAPMAQAFAGVIVNHENEARRGDDPASRIRSNNGSIAGNCGHYGFCGAFAPVACYTCQFFQPWLDGPHEEILNQLEVENEKVRRITGDSTISTVLDRTMLAVAEVVRLCELRKGCRQKSQLMDKLSSEDVACNDKKEPNKRGRRGHD